MKSLDLLRSSTSLLAVMLLAACEGGGSGSSPSPIASASPTPTPPTSPTPSPAGPTFVGAKPGERLGGEFICANGDVVKDSQGHVTALTNFTGARPPVSFELQYRDVDTYATDINGFGGSLYGPADKKVSPVAAYDQFITAYGSELFIARPNSLSGSRTFATIGLDTGERLCFFAVGLPSTSFPGSGLADYGTVTDGLARVAGQDLRLLPSFGTLKIDFTAKTAQLSMALAGRGDAFSNFAVQPAVPITTVSATFALDNHIFPSLGKATLIGSNGYSGTVRGQLIGKDSGNVSGVGGVAAVLSFELAGPGGNVIVGAVVAERSLI